METPAMNDLPADPFGRIGEPPADARPASRAERNAEAERQRAHYLAMVDEVADALLERRPAGAEACGFVGGALRTWLDLGGDLLGDKFLRLRGVPGNNRTGAEVLRALRDPREEDNGAAGP